MKYSKEDINFEQITPKALENLCYDLLVKYGFFELIWREGGADNGRDIEAKYTFNNIIKPKVTKWFFECKHYTTGGVPPEHLNSKIAWADAERPDFLVVFTSSYLTNGSRTWLEKLALQKPYDIISIEGEELKDRLINYSDLVERYFSQSRYEQMLKDSKDLKTKFNINPSYELLREIVENIDLSKLDDEEHGFILLNFYNQYCFFESRNDFYGDFEENIINRLLDYLKENITNENLLSFEVYKNDYIELGSIGIFDDMLCDEKDWHKMKRRNFQLYDFHLNYKHDQEHWKLALYLFVIHGDVAFEIFKAEKTEIRIIRDFTPNKINQLSLNLSAKTVNDYRKYLEHASA